MKRVSLLVLLSAMAWAQTTINGSRTILGRWDASGASSTAPAKAGTSAPGTCILGDVFFDTDAAAGENLYVCTATNVWTQITGGGGGGAQVEYKYYVAAICQNTVAGAGFSTPTSGAPTPACGSDATDPTHGVLQFTDTSTQTVYGHFRYPASLTNVDLYIRWRAPVATSGNTVWQIKIGCTGTSERIQDLAWNAAQTVTSAASGTALGEIQATISTLTLTGCAAGERLNFSFLRNPAHASDNLGATAELLELVFAITR